MRVSSGVNGISMKGRGYDMIKWEEPMLVSLTGVSGAAVECESGSTNTWCNPGTNASSKCDPTGTAAGQDCWDGNSALYCGAGNTTD